MRESYQVLTCVSLLIGYEPAHWVQAVGRLTGQVPAWPAHWALLERSHPLLRSGEGPRRGCDGAGTAERSYPRPEVRGGGCMRSYLCVHIVGQWLGGATPPKVSGARRRHLSEIRAARRSH